MSSAMKSWPAAFHPLHCPNKSRKMKIVIWEGKIYDAPLGRIDGYRELRSSSPGIVTPGDTRSGAKQDATGDDRVELSEISQNTYQMYIYKRQRFGGRSSVLSRGL